MAEQVNYFEKFVTFLAYFLWENCHPGLKFLEFACR